MSDPAFELPRLAALYDEICAGRGDTAFYVDLAARLDARTVADVGCGTGVLACELAARGLRVTGVEPAAAMLDIARERCDSVRWVCGDAWTLEADSVDLVVMNGHVAQVFLDDAAWDSTLAAVRAALHEGGRAAFELRNPAARAWTTWNPDESRVHVTHPTDGPVTVWVAGCETSADLVTFEWRYHFRRTGEILSSSSTLRFPDRASVERSLDVAGLALESLYGDWDRSPFTPASREMIFVAVGR